MDPLVWLVSSFAAQVVLLAASILLLLMFCLGALRPWKRAAAIWLLLMSLLAATIVAIHLVLEWQTGWLEVLLWSIAVAATELLILMCVLYQTRSSRPVVTVRN